MRDTWDRRPARLGKRAYCPPADEAMIRDDSRIVFALFVSSLITQSYVQRRLIREATIKSHLLRIFSKLGVEDHTAAVTMALEKGLLRLESR